MSEGHRATKESWSLYMREYRKKNPLLMKQIDLKKRFGVSLEDYNTMLKNQNSVCKICGNPETSLDHRTKTIRSLAVDHCHTSGKIRGLLCGQCNQAIGLLDDNIERLKSAIKYLDGA